MSQPIEFGDISRAAAEAIDGDRLPFLKAFFQECPFTINTDPRVVDIIKEAQDVATPVGQLFIVMNGALEIQKNNADNRLDDAVAKGKERLNATAARSQLFESERDRLRIQLQEYLNTNINLESRITRVTTQLDEANARVQAINTQLQTVTTQKAVFEAQARDAVTQKAQLEAQKTTLEIELQQASATAAATIPLPANPVPEPQNAPPQHPAPQPAPGAQSNIDRLTAAINNLAGSRGGDGNDTNMPHPTPFTGSDMDSVARAQAFRTWRGQITARWNARPQEFLTERAKIIYAAYMLGGAAADGVSHGLAIINANPHNMNVWEWKTGEAFLEHLASRYATVDLAQIAEGRLHELKQKGKFARFTDFLVEFTNLTDMARWDGASRVRALKAKMDSEMLDKVASQINTPADDDFPGWAGMTQKLATNIENAKVLRGIAGPSGNNQNNGNNNNNRNNNGGNAAGGDPMDLDAIKLAVTKLDPAERQRRLDENLCLHCGKPGHRMMQCRSLSRKGDNRGSRDGGRQQGYGQGYNNQGYQGGYPQQTPASFGNYGGSYYGNNGYSQQFVQPRGGAPRGGYGRGGYDQQHLRQFDIPQVNVLNPGFIIPETGSTNGDYNHGVQYSGPHVHWDKGTDNQSENESGASAQLQISAVGSLAKSITLSSYIDLGQCRGKCLPPNVDEQEAPCAVAATPSPYQATVEEVEDEGEPNWEPETNNRLSEAARARRSRHRREWRQRAREREIKKRALTEGPRWTQAPPGARAVMVPNTPSRKPLPSRLAAGSRKPALKPILKRRPLTTPRREKLNAADLRLLSTPNFLLLARQKGVTVMRTTLAELEEAARSAPAIHLPDLPEEFFLDLLKRRGRPEDYTSRLPTEFFTTSSMTRSLTSKLCARSPRKMRPSSSPKLTNPL
ncbi:hypothetical protein N657DRAFT_638276 [Parathielavia appendiculata]|uniref:CCHC-type domain-containing protein n=1 Tax=Parathielavia appendiculata TaxID=2587402 RepID=A0AAN6TP95_9PEZI|nr:hypothetical protein N657DRAFT_638276 [Parathielavia appendiculata]